MATAEERFWDTLGSPYLWLAIAVVSLTIGVVSALGEWVFHWWDEPGEWASLIGLAMGMLSLGTAASRFDLRRVSRAQARFEAKQDRVLEGQERLAQGQERLAVGQERLATAAGQAEQTRILQAIQAEQREHTQLLREVVASFRRPA